MVVQRKHSTINMIKFYTEFDVKIWNKFLYRCLKTQDVNKLTQTLYGLQCGMADLAEDKMNTPDIINAFLRVQRSIENTLKQIYREDNYNPLYDPKNKDLKDKFIDDKKSKDLVFETFLKKERF